MEAVTGYCCWKKIIPVPGDATRDPPLTLPGLNFRDCVSPKIHSIPLSAPSRRSCIRPLRSSSSQFLSAASPPDSFDRYAKEFVPGSTPIPEINEPTIRARFVLNRECSFGERFFLVGEDPSLGSWEPSAAIPMIWSEGHTWYAEQDIPIGSKVQFKFIMKNASGEIKWQPGPDRVLNLWETDKTITVVEDWEAAELQNVTEDPPEEPFAQGYNPEAAAKVAQDAKKDDKLAEIYNTVMDDFIQNAEDPVSVPDLSSLSIGAGGKTSEEKQKETADEFESAIVGEHSTPFHSDEDNEEEIDIDIPRVNLNLPSRVEHGAESSTAN